MRDGKTEQREDQQGDTGCESPLGGATFIGKISIARIDQHDDEQVEHHDGSGVDQQLHESQEHGIQ